MSEPGADSTPESAPATEPAITAGTPPNALPVVEGPGRLRARFAIAYTALGIIMAAALTGLVVLVIQPGHHAGPPWSTWKPTQTSTQKMAAEIADHVAHR